LKGTEAKNRSLDDVSDEDPESLSAAECADPAAA